MLTDQEANELNERCAEAMGWETGEVFFRGRSPLMGRTEDEYVTRWQCPGAEYALDSLPDFCRDTMAFGYLLEWLDKRPVAYQVNRSYYGAGIAHIWTKDGSGDIHQFGDTPVEAICRAIIAYTEAAHAQ